MCSAQLVMGEPSTLDSILSFPFFIYRVTVRCAHLRLFSACATGKYLFPAVLLHLTIVWSRLGRRAGTYLYHSNSKIKLTKSILCVNLHARMVCAQVCSCRQRESFLVVNVLLIMVFPYQSCLYSCNFAISRSSMITSVIR